MKIVKDKSLESTQKSVDSPNNSITMISICIHYFTQKQRRNHKHIEDKQSPEEKERVKLKGI